MDEEPRPTKYCRKCGLELVHTGRGQLKVARPDMAEGAPAFTLIGPRVLVTHCPVCGHKSVWAAREASAADIARAEKIAAAANARG